MNAAASAGGGTRDIRGKLAMARLPSMPQVLLRLLDLCHKEDVSLNDLAGVVGRDAGMAARVFALASSSVYHGRGRPATLEQCLSLLRMNAIKTIVINESVLQVFNRFTSGQGIDLKRFWGHSLRCALIARELARRVDGVSPEEAYLGGLLHDVGQLAILATDPGNYTRMFYEYEDNHALCARENEVFSLNHAEVGAWLVEKWELDSFLGDSVLYHHESVGRVAVAHPLVRIVLAANRLAMLRGREPGDDENSLVALCGAARLDLGGLLEAVEIELVTVAEQLGIEIPAPGDTGLSPATSPIAPAKNISRLAIRLQDIVLVDRTLAGQGAVDGVESAVQGLARAIKVLFDVDAALWFEAADPSASRFVARPLALRGSRLAQLEFSRGSSLLYRTLEGGPALVLPGDRGGEIIDEQVLRLVGGEGMLLVPLASRRAAVGVLVARVEAAEQVTALRERLACIAHFGHGAAETLEGVRSGHPGGASDPGLKQRLNSMVHEISNPLSIIRNYLHVLEGECADRQFGQPELGVVKGEIDRIGKILTSARQESDRKKSSAPGPVNLNRVVEDLVALCRGSLAVGPGIDIRLDLATDLPEIVSDADSLKQLLLNLLKNSIEAMPKGGVIRVTTAPWGSGSGASHAEIAVEDNGPGIPREVLGRLYQQVVSTKGGQHQGLGLAIVGQLVRDLRGLINCRSSPQGTRFQVLLPFSGKS